MKKRVLAIIFIILTFIACRSNEKNRLEMNNNEQEIGKIERYNYKATEGGKKSVVFKQREWIINIWQMPNGRQFEYAPARDFYQITKRFYNNGMISERGKYLANLPFGLWEYFDESGRLVKTVDEDAKFGKVKPADIVAFMERQGIFNRETGESIFFEKPLPTDGTFYREVATQFNIILLQETVTEQTRKKLTMKKYDEEGKLIPVWIIYYIMDDERLTYFIDGNNVTNFLFDRQPFYSTF